MDKLSSFARTVLTALLLAVVCTTYAQPVSDCPYADRKLTKEELANVQRYHEQWIADGGHDRPETNGLRRANLCRANLNNALLDGAQLSGADLLLSLLLLFICRRFRPTFSAFEFKVSKDTLLNQN